MTDPRSIGPDPQGVPAGQDPLAEAAAPDLAGPGGAHRDPAASETAGKPTLVPSPGFADWLGEAGGCLAFSTYQAGRIFFLGSQNDGSLYAQDRVVGSAMGLAMNRSTLWIGNRDQIWRFANTGPGRIDGVDYDAVYMPRLGYMVGGSNTHDVLADVTFRGERFEFVFANTQFDCIAAPDPHYSFRPLWAPDFMPDLRPLDRCHLNGIAARDGEVRYATICGESTRRLGWKETRTETGFIVDLHSDARMCTHLSMPHSPRWHDGRLWVLNSGEGDFGYVDMAAGRFVPVAPCAGFARGLSFVGRHAVIALSRLRDTSFPTDMNLIPRIEQRGVRQRCGLLVIDTQTGHLDHWLTILGPVPELYDVVHVPGVRRPWTPGFREPQQHKWRVDVPADVRWAAFRPADDGPNYEASRGQQSVDPVAKDAEAPAQRERNAASD